MQFFKSWFRTLEPAPEMRSLVPGHVARRYQVLPLDASPGTLRIAVDRTGVHRDLTILERLTQRRLERVIVPASKLGQAIFRYALTSDPGPRLALVRPRWTESGVAFPVADVNVATEPLLEETLGQGLCRDIRVLEDCSDLLASCLEMDNQHHALVQAAYLAFSQHRPLVLSPDMIWLTIVQGLARHIHLNPESCRSLLVSHQGQAPLTIERDDPVWEDVIAEFSGQLRTHLGEDMHDLLVSNFSTTGPVERVASQIVLMDAVKAYFQYEVKCICGIPTIRLEGTPADWQSIRQRTAALLRFDLDWWLGPLLHVLDEFVQASQGSVDRRFWNDLYQRHLPGGGYGGPYDKFTGWIGWFIPYLRPDTRNPLFTTPDTPVHLHMFDPALSSAPVLCSQSGRDSWLTFVSGMLGIEQDAATMALRPKTGWAVFKAGGGGQRR